jgi:spermidine synthase
MNRNFLLIIILFFFSGMSALIYEILWLKELGLLFGNASYAMATTLAAFFWGLAVGSYQWGKRVYTYNNPLKLYALLELGVAGCAAGYFIILKLYALIYPEIFAWLGNDRFFLTAVKFVLAILILFPPAYFMGGTLPVISQFAVRHVNQLGQKVSLLYVANTLGAVSGVFLAGFYLPGLLGFTKSYLLAMLMTVCVALIAIMISKTQHIQDPQPIEPTNSTGNTILDLKLLAFLSGLLILSLQVLWGRMFAQVLQNSVYTFAIILMVFLFCLALGGMLANRLMLIPIDPQKSMFGLLLTGSLLVAITPFEFFWLTDNLHYIGANEDWNAYLIQVTLKAFLIMGPPLVLLGSIFPLLIKLSEKENIAAGIMIGQLASINTAGAILGPLLAGFVILDTLGLWSGIRLVAIVYAICAWLWINHCRLNKTHNSLLPALAILLMVSVLDTAKLPVVKIDPVIDDESLLETWEGSAGTIAVIRRGEHLKVKFNNYYTLGGTGSYELEQFQGYLPILLHTNPNSVYVLGLGTGITAGAGLAFPIKRLVVTELIPEVVKASDKYFSRYTNQLFYDPRATIIEEDGRNYLRGTREHFDVITSDLFVPWKAGVGNLYSLEHYQTILNRLNDNGLFMQWLPTYQLSKTELFIIIRTMLEVFPQVTVWRGDFSALKPIIGLLGHQTIAPLSKNAWLFKQDNANKERIPLLAHYVGNLQPIRDIFSDAMINTDDLPIIEFMAPITQRQIKSGKRNWMAGDELIAFMRQLQEQDNSFYLSEIDTNQLALPEAGLHIHYAQLLKQQGKLTKAQQEMEIFKQLTDRQ